MRTLLSVSPQSHDHSALHAILDHSSWTLLSASGLDTALGLFPGRDISVVLCERDFLIGTWIDLLENLEKLADPPPLVVTSRLADERLWVEVLNLGAWDVLAKPFDRKEVMWALESACRHRRAISRTSSRRARRTLL